MLDLYTYRCDMNRDSIRELELFIILALTFCCIACAWCACHLCREMWNGTAWYLHLWHFPQLFYSFHLLQMQNDTIKQMCKNVHFMRNKWACYNKMVHVHVRYCPLLDQDIPIIIQCVLLSLTRWFRLENRKCTHKRASHWCLNNINYFFFL